MARVSALLARATAAQKKRSSDERYTDFAVQFVEVDRDERNRLRPTGRKSKVYGGRWDSRAIDDDGRAGAYVDCEPGELKPLTLKCSPVQFGVLTDDETPHILLLGSRRSSKTETMARWFVKQVCMWPRKPLSLLVQKHAKARKLVEKKLLPLLPSRWVRDYRKRQDEVALLFVNGVQIDCLSGKVEDDARGDGVPALGVDERQIIPTKSVETAMLSVSEGGDRFQTVETGTPLQGDFEEYWEKARVSPSYRAIILSISDNVFLPSTFDEKTGKRLPKFIITRRSVLDPKFFAQEIGLWNTENQRYEPQFISLSGVVYEWYERARHARRWSQRKAVFEQLYGRGNVDRHALDDITAEVTKARFKWESDVVIGLDFNVSPMVAAVYRIIRGQRGIGNVYWLVDEVILDDHADATRMGIALNQAGYSGALIVADASDSRAKHYRRALQQQSHKVVWPARNNRNPEVKDRVAAMNAAMLNANNDTRWFVDPDHAPRCAKAIQSQQRDAAGRPDKTTGFDHYCDASGYPIVKLAPVAMDSQRTVQGRHAA